jgi:phosphoribosylanthranilate isomerase
MTVKVKICGITNHQDAAFAVQFGVDAIGFIFAQSPRRVTQEKARDIISTLPPFMKTVGVFVNENPDAIRSVMEGCNLDLVQLHGDETPDVCSELMPYSIKAFQLKDESSLEKIKPYCGKVRAFLFDAYAKDKRGGTGSTFDWDLAIKGKALGVPVLLSGGLNPSNIESAIATVRPYAVDINSGIEASPGKKDPALMKELIKNIKNSEANP